MRLIPILLATLGFLSVAHPPTHADEISAKYKPAIQEGLEWLVKLQNKDGSWPARDKESDVSCTALAGLALLMEGSTAANGMYAGNVNKAVDWIVRNCQAGADDGLIGTRDRLDRTNYMFGQSYALLFLASAYAREEKTDAKDLDARLTRVRQRRMEEVLKRVVQFSAKAQSSTGGWFFISCQDGHDEDDASATLAQMLALWAAQQADIKLPKETLTKAFAYLEKITTPGGGIPLSSRSAGKAGTERPGLTIAAFASTLGSNQVNPVLAKKWFSYSQFTVTPRSEGYARFHLALAMHGLGEHGYAKLFEAKNPSMVWSKSRKVLFDELLGSQSRDGSWVLRDWNPNPAFGTAISLITLQLDNEHVPIFRAKRNDDRFIGGHSELALRAER
jgi:hypothetical protein